MMDSPLRDLLEIAAGEPPRLVRLVDVRRTVIRRRLMECVAVAAVVALAAGVGAAVSARGARGHPAPPTATRAGRCQLPVGNAPAPNGNIVFGVISLRNALWPTVPVHQGPWRYWQKDGLWILDGHQTVTITVPKAWRSRAAITWGANTGIVSTLRLPGTLLTPGCPAGPLMWNPYYGGFYLRSQSACVPLEFSLGRRSAVVQIGVGRRCGPVP